MRKLFLFAALAIMVSASAQSINSSKPSATENTLLSTIRLSYPIEEVKLVVDNGEYGLLKGEATWEFSIDKEIDEKGEYTLYLGIFISKGNHRLSASFSEAEAKKLISEMKRINSAPYPENNPKNINGKFITKRKAEITFHMNNQGNRTWTLYGHGFESPANINLTNFDVFFEHFSNAVAKMDSYK